MKQTKSFVRVFLLSSSFFAFYRIYQVKFPFDIVHPWMFWFPLFGIALGPLVPKPWISLRAFSWATAFLSTVFLLGTFFNQNVSLHVFVSRQYYPYPPPPDFYLRCALLVLSLICAVPVFAMFTARAFHDAADSVRGKMAAFFFVSAACGKYLCYFITLLLGAYAVLLCGVLLLLIFTVSHKKILTLGLSACILTGFVFSRNEDVFLLWRAGQYKKLHAQWTPYYYLNFISFNEDRCLGGVYNYLMLWIVCKDTSLIEKELKFFHSEIGKGKESALVIGRAEGATFLTLDFPEPHLKRGTAVEIDPVVPGRVSREFSRYNQHVYKKQDFRAVSMDWRTFLKKDTQRYDVAVWDGLGIRLFVEPFTNFFQEDLVYTRESFEQVFNKRLKEDGILAGNWGSTQENEVYPLIANMPKGVHTIAFWTTFNDYPLMGLPVILFAASRDKKRLDEIAAVLREIKPFRQIKTNINLRPYQFTDDKPFLQKFIQPPLFVLFSPFWMLPLGIAAAVLRKQKEPGNILPLFSFVVFGILSGALLTLFMSRCSRFAHDGGAAYGFEILFSLFFLAAGCAFLVPVKKGAFTLFIALFFLAVGCAFTGIFSQRELLFALSLWLGFFSALSLRGLPTAPSSDLPASAFCGMAGFLCGNLFAQIIPWILGYRLSGFAAGAWCAFLYILCVFPRARKMPGAAEATLSGK